MFCVGDLWWLAERLSSLSLQSVHNNLSFQLNIPEQLTSVFLGPEMVILHKLKTVHGVHGARLSNWDILPATWYLWGSGSTRCDQAVQALFSSIWREVYQRVQA